MKPLYLTISGSHSTGKTALMQELAPRLQKKLKQSVSTVTGIPESIADRYPLNESGTAETQFAIEAEFLRVENRYRTRHKIADRSLLDRYAYTRANGLSLDGFYQSMLVPERLPYDLIFYLPIEDHNVKLEGNGLRSSDPKYRLKVQDALEGIIKETKVPVHVLSGDMDERVYQAMKVINLYC